MSMSDYNDLIGINEDWYEDQAKKSLKWDTDDNWAIGYGATVGAYNGAVNKNSNVASGAAAGIVGSVIGVYIAKGIKFLVYKAESLRRSAQRSRDYEKGKASKDYTDAIYNFIQSPIKGESVNKKERENGVVDIYCGKNDEYGYLITYDNRTKSFVIQTFKHNTQVGTLIPENKNDVKTCIRKYIAPYVREEDLSEYFDKGYGYVIRIRKCPENDFTKEIMKIADTQSMDRTYKESTEYNELF